MLAVFATSWYHCFLAQDKHWLQNTGFVCIARSEIFALHRRTPQLSPK